MGAGTSRTGAAPAGANQSTDAAVSPDSAAQAAHPAPDIASSAEVPATSSPDAQLLVLGLTPPEAAEVPGGSSTEQPGAATTNAPEASQPAASPQLTATSPTSQRSGVSLSFLKWFGEYVEQSWSTRQVVNDIIKVQTAQERCCYLDLLEPVEVGAPLLYIIHTWDRPFHKMIKVLSKGLALAYPDLPEEQMFVWIDVFAVRQWGPALGPDDLLNLRTAISSCQGAVLCLDTAAAALTRSWVLWELWVVSCTLGADKLMIMSGFVRGPDLVQKLRMLDLSVNSFTSELADKALLLASLTAAGHLPSFSTVIRSLLLESARASALRQESVSNTTKQLADEASAAVQAAVAAYEMALAAGSDGAEGSASVQAAQQAEEKAKTMARDHQVAYAMSVFRAAATLEASGMREEAHALFRASLGISNEELGGVHAAVEGATLLALGGTYTAAGQWDDAGACLRKVLELDVKSFGPQHLRTAKNKTALAVVLRRSGQLLDAEQLYKEALEVLHPPGATPTVSVASVQMGLVSVLKLDGRDEAAATLCRTAYNTFNSLAGRYCSKTLAALAQLAQLERRCGRLEQAEQLVRDLDQRRLMVATAATSYQAAVEAAHNQYLANYAKDNASISVQAPSAVQDSSPSAGSSSRTAAAPPTLIKGLGPHNSEIVPIATAAVEGLATQLSGNNSFTADSKVASARASPNTVAGVQAVPASVDGSFTADPRATSVRASPNTGASVQAVPASVDGSFTADPRATSVRASPNTGASVQAVPASVDGSFTADPRATSVRASPYSGAGVVAGLASGNGSFTAAAEQASGRASPYSGAGVVAGLASGNGSFTAAAEQASGRASPYSGAGVAAGLASGNGSFTAAAEQASGRASPYSGAGVVAGLASGSGSFTAAAEQASGRASPYSGAGVVARPASMAGDVMEVAKRISGQSSGNGSFLMATLRPFEKESTLEEQTTDICGGGSTTADELADKVTATAAPAGSAAFDLEAASQQSDTLNTRSGGGEGAQAGAEARTSAGSGAGAGAGAGTGAGAGAGAGAAPWSALTGDLSDAGSGPDLSDDDR